MAEGEILPPLGHAGASRAPAKAMGEPLAMVSAMARQPAVQRALPAIGLLGATALAALAYWGLQSPVRTPVFQGLADADKAAVAEALQGAGISYDLDPGSGAIEVAEDNVHRARMMLAAQGLPKAAPSGDALLAKLPMGSSRAVEDETLRGAREMDLARTIEAIDSVKSARIHLAVPEPSVFVRDQAAPAASVMLTLQPGRALTGAQVRAIRHLVGSSVPGLAADQVSVIDQSGALLSQDEGTDDPSFQLQLRMEERYRQAVLALLGPVLGQNNFTTEVHVDLDRTESQSTRETYPKDDRALLREEGNRSTTSAMTPAGGIPGTLANQPPQATQLTNKPTGAPVAGAGPATPTSTGDGQTAETYDRTFNVGREISVTRLPEGRLARLTVAVALRDGPTTKPRTVGEIAALEKLVKGAVGFNADRGDVVAISARVFEPVVEPVRRWYDEPWLLPLVRQAGAAVVALLVLLLIGRPLVRALKARAGERARTFEAERELLTAAAHGRLAAPDITVEMIAEAPGYEERAALVRQFVRQNPERAAIVVRQLMQERRHG
jgi:flagellar M-ring protein FliF